MPYRASQVFAHDLERVKFALHAAGIGVWEVDIMNRQVIWDDRCCALIGLPGGHILPFDETFQFIHREDVDRVKAAVDAALAGVDGGAFDATYRVVGGDNILRWVNFTGTAYFDADGKATRFGGVARDVTAELTARQKTEESEAFTKLLSDSVPAMIFYMDTDQRYTSYNNTFMEWFRVGPTEAVGMHTRDLIGEAAYERIRPRLAKAFAGERVQFEMPAPTRISPDRWLSIVYTPHRDAAGAVRGIIVHATDVTQSKRTELALRESEARFRVLFERAPIATSLYVGRDMRIEMANQRMLEVWGKSASVVGKPILEGLPELEGQQFLQLLDDVYTTGRPHVGVGEKALLEVGGVLGTYYYDYTYQPIVDDAGNVYAIMNMAIDVTERVLAGKKTDEANEIIRDAVELAALGTWTIDARSLAFEASDRLRAWLGYNPDDSIDADALFARRAEAVLTDARAAEAGKLDLELDVWDQLTGQPRVVHVRGQMLYDKHGRERELRGMALDVTLERSLRAALEREVQLRTEELQATNEELQATNEELYESNENLIQSNEELSQYAYVASHDLQEPLRKIRFFSERVASSGELSATTSPLLARVIASAERMTTLIQALLEYSRLQQQAAERMLPVNLGDVVQSVVNDFELMISDKHATVQVGKLPVVEAVPLQMNQLFYNLLGNALKFTNPAVAPRIVIGCERMTEEQVTTYISKPAVGSEYYQISIADNGIGFDQAFAEQIFEVFKRLHSKGSYEGSGIGLALCRRIVRNHGGALYAVSTPGEGAVFHVLLAGKMTGKRSIL